MGIPYVEKAVCNLHSVFHRCFGLYAVSVRDCHFKAVYKFSLSPEAFKFGLKRVQFFLEPPVLLLEFLSAVCLRGSICCCGNKNSR